MIRAPFSGTVSGKPVQPGTVVGPGTAILRIVGTQGIYFEGNVTSEAINDLRPGQPVTIAVDAVPGRTFPGAVRAVGRAWTVTRGHRLALVALTAMLMVGAQIVAAVFLTMAHSLRTGGMDNPVVLSLLDAGAAGASGSSWRPATGRALRWRKSTAARRWPFR